MPIVKTKWTKRLAVMLCAALPVNAFLTGTSITGYTGRSGDTLHISIPEEYEESPFTLSVFGAV